MSEGGRSSNSISRLYLRDREVEKTMYTELALEAVDLTVKLQGVLFHVTEST